MWLLIIVHGKLITIAGDSHEVCLSEEFEAECASGHVILVSSARYGRMRLGRCVKRDFGYLEVKSVIKSSHIIISIVYFTYTTSNVFIFIYMYRVVLPTC